MCYTLIIPTHNRSSYLKRNIAYLTELNFSSRLIIADSSDDEYALRNQKLVDEASQQLNISYFCLQGKDKYIEKMIKALSLVETPTLMISGDDDFVIPVQIEKCAQFLIENPDFSIACGKIAEFRKLDSKLVWKNYEQIELLEESPINRLLDYIPQYRPTFYSVHRAESIQDNFKNVFTENLGRSLAERLFCILDVIQGKVKVFDELFMVREKGLTLTDESGNHTWPDEVGKSIEASKDNLNFYLYQQLISTEISKSYAVVDLASKQREVCKLVEEDFNKWMTKKNLSINKIGFLAYRAPVLYSILRKLKARLNSYHYLSSFNREDRAAISRVSNYVK